MEMDTKSKLAELYGLIYNFSFRWFSIKIIEQIVDGALSLLWTKMNVYFRF